LEALLETADRQGGGRRLYFYFSGHGAAAKDAIENVALLLADWSRKRANLGLSSQSYTNELISYGLFEELAVFLDCCRTKPALVGRGITLTPTLSTQKTRTRKLFACATEADDSAWECWSGGQSEDQPGGPQWRGVFTRSLLAILKRMPDGVAAAQLKDLLESEVNRANTPQQAYVDTDFLSPSRFGGSGTLPQLRVTFSAGRVGPVTLLDGSFLPAGTHDPSTGPWIMPLKAGLYMLRDMTGASRLLNHPETEPIAF
jgi:hypothetical protein